MGKSGKGGTRKTGRGKRKVAKSRFMSYAGIFGASEIRRVGRKQTRELRLERRAAARWCRKCGLRGFRGRRQLLRHVKRCQVVIAK